MSFEVERVDGRKVQKSWKSLFLEALCKVPDKVVRAPKLIDYILSQYKFPSRDYIRQRFARRKRIFLREGILKIKVEKGEPILLKGDALLGAEEQILRAIEQQEG